MKYELRFYQRCLECGAGNEVVFYFNSLREAAQAAELMEKHFPQCGFTDFTISPVNYEEGE